MRYDAWNKEYLHLRMAEEKIRDAAEREWLLGDIMVRVRVQARHEPTERPCVAISVHKWHVQEGSTAVLANGRRLEDGYFDYVPNPLDELTAVQIRRVAHCKSIAEAWALGERDDLPETAEPYPDGIA